MSVDGALSGKTAVITGATAGIGLASLLALAAEGASVIGVGRSQARCRQAEELVRASVPGAQAQYLLADLSSQAQVRDLAGQIMSLLQERGLSGLDILVNNAGLYAQNLTRTVDGIELTLAVNHLAVFLLTHELLPVLTSGADHRVITVSSHSHYWARMNIQRLNKPFPYLGIMAYARSKLSNVLFTREFNRRMAGKPVRAFAVDPGLVKTQIALKERGFLSQRIWAWRSQKGTDPSVPAQTVLHLSRENDVLQNPADYWYNSQPRVPSQNAENEVMAAELWKLSCQLCGISNSEPFCSGDSR